MPEKRGCLTGEISLVILEPVAVVSIFQSPLIATNRIETLYLLEPILMGTLKSTQPYLLVLCFAAAGKRC
jgi:hypothetical protein